MRWSGVAVVVALAGALESVEGQVPGIDLNVTARAGAFRPQGDLAEFGGSRAALQDGTAVGASVELRLPFLPVAFRGNVDHVRSATGSVNGNEIASGNRLTMLSGDLVFHLLPSVLPLQVYLLAGAGVKKYDFDDGYATALFSFPDASDTSAHLGAGVGLKLGPIGLVAEATDYVSRFELAYVGGSRLQNDLFITVGLRLGLF